MGSVAQEGGVIIYTVQGGVTICQGGPRTIRNGEVMAWSDVARTFGGLDQFQARGLPPYQQNFSLGSLIQEANYQTHRSSQYSNGGYSSGQGFGGTYNQSSGAPNWGY